MRRLLMSCAALVLLTAPAMTEDAKTPPAPPAAPSASAPAPKPELHGMFAEADTNKDGKVSKAEFLAESEKKFAEMDANKDGEITPDELKAHRDEMRERFRNHKPGGDEPPPPPAAPEAPAAK